MPHLLPSFIGCLIRLFHSSFLSVHSEVTSLLFLFHIPHLFLCYLLHPQTTSFTYTPPPSFIHRSTSFIHLIYVLHSHMGCSLHLFTLHFLHSFLSSLPLSFIYHLLHSLSSHLLVYSYSACLIHSCSIYFIHLFRLSLSFTFTHVLPLSLIHIPPTLFIQTIFFIHSFPTSIHHR